MRYPPLKALEAVKKKRVDGRTRRLVLHYRPFFNVTDAHHRPVEREEDIVNVSLTQRGERHYAELAGGKERIPG